jgi:capsid protein
MNDETQVDVQMVINELLEQLKQAWLQVAILRTQLQAERAPTPVQTD